MQSRKVSQATVNDPVGLFIATECAFEKDAKITRIAMNEMFDKWCVEEGYRYKISRKKHFATLPNMEQPMVKDGHGSCLVRDQVER